MTLDVLFYIVNAVALVGWFLLIFTPRWRGTQWVISSCAIQILLGIIYTGLVVLTFSQINGAFLSLDQLSHLFQNHTVLLAGWIHYLAFDLFIGFWETQDAQRRGLPHLLLVPCLVLTLLFGPAGLLGYCIIRFVAQKKSAMKGEIH